jgi:ABC-2 type transport system permease protein
MSYAKYLEVMKTSMINSFAYVGEFVGTNLFLGIILVIYFCLYSAIFSTMGVSEYQGYTIVNMVWYILITETVFLSKERVGIIISDEIKSGDVAYNLNKPYNYVLYKFADVMGTSLVKLPSILIIGAIVSFFIIGLPNVSLITIPFVLASIILGITLNYVIFILIGILAFWLEDVRSIDWIYSKFIFVIGGMLLPLEFFPTLLKDISLVLPFSYITYAPARLFVDFSFANAIRFMSGQVIWIAIMAAILGVVYHFGAKKLSINGG